MLTQPAVQVLSVDAFLTMHLLRVQKGIQGLTWTLLALDELRCLIIYRECSIRANACRVFQLPKFKNKSKVREKLRIYDTTTDFS